MSGITILWAIFSIMFFGLTLVSFKISKRKENQIKLPKYYETKFGGKPAKNTNRLTLSSYDKYINYSNEEINKFITNFNKNNKIMNQIQMIGYMVACITSIVSLRLTI